MKKKFFAIVLAFCMVLTMMPSMAWAEGQPNLSGLTLHGGGDCARPGEGNVGNGIFTESMTVMYDGNKITDYTVSVKSENGGTISQNVDGTFDYIPSQVGTWPITITYQDKDYVFSFYVSENDVPHTRYFYALEDSEIMLPHNERGFGAQLSGEKYDGKKYQYDEFAIESVISNKEEVVSVSNCDGEYFLTAEAIGEATITITHNGFANSKEVKEIKISVTDKKWDVALSAENDCRSMLPGSAVTLYANVRYFEYNQEEDFITDVEKPYVLEWDLENEEQRNEVEIEASGDQAIVKAKIQAGYQEVPIRLEVYEADTNGKSVGEPVASIAFACYIEEEFYTIELGAFQSDLKKGHSMTVVPSLMYHYVKDGINHTEKVENTSVKFCVSGNNNLDIREEDGKFIITRPDAGNAGFGIGGEIDGEYKCDRWFELDWIGEGGDEPQEPEHSTYFLGSLPAGNTSLKDRDISYEDRYINMSLAPDAEENCFYFAVPEGMNCQPEAFQLINSAAKYSQDSGTDRSRAKDMLQCEGTNLFAENFSMQTVRTVDIESQTYKIYKINLNQYLGHGDIRVVVDEDGDKKADNWVDLRFALNVTVRGNAEGVKRLYNAADAQRNLFNFESEYPDVAFAQKDNARTGVYYNAMDVYHQGKENYKQGGFSELALELEDGYVLNQISFLINGEKQPAKFQVVRYYDYAVYDANGHMLTDPEIRNCGWKGGQGSYGGKVMSGADKGQEKAQGFAATEQVVLGEGAGSNDQHFVASFLKEQSQYSLKYLGALTEYLVFYENYYNYEGTIEIVFDVQKLPTASEVSKEVEDFDGKICIIPESNQGGHKYVVSSEVLQDYVLTGEDGLNAKLQKEYHDNYSVEKVFEITATADGEPVSELNKYITITIPKSMFKGNPKHYKVMNIDDNGNMVEMETTYEINGDYIVFKTGHLSKYAIITDEDLTGGDNTGGGASGGAIAPVPSDVATSGTAGDKVTTAKTEVKTSEKVHADGTKETVAEVKVSAANQREIIRQAKQNDSKEIILEVQARAAGNATSANVQLEKAFLNQLLNETSASLTIKTPFGDAAYTQDELKALSEKTDGDIVTLAIAKEDPAAEEAERVAQAKAAAKQVDLKARSSKTSKGIKVVFKADAESKAFIESIEEIGYTVKYRFYRSQKKTSAYKAMLTKDKPVYINTNGKTGTKYYYKVQLRVYDQNGKLIAATTLKQCKYACRTWTK